MSNEQTIQDILFQWLAKKKQSLIVPNVYLFPHESDLVSVSKAGLATEYEIKVTRADLNAEFRNKKRKHTFLNGGITFKKHIPNYFYFAFPDILHDCDYIPSNIPFYAGVLIVDLHGREVHTLRKAKRLHSLKLSQNRVEYLSRGLMLRYWRERLRKVS